MTQKCLVLVGIFLLLMPLVVQAQAQINPADCLDKCESGILFHKGAWNAKLKICEYGLQSACKYGCVDTRISAKPECSLYPATLPDNDTQANDIIFQIVKDMYEREKKFGHFSIFGTEYVFGQNGTLFIKLLDSNELPINNGFCSITIYYPNKAIKFMDNAPTAFLENGIYYKDFFVPTTEGLYIADASCIYADSIYRYNLPSQNCGYDGNIVGGSSPQPITFQHVDCTPFQTSGTGTYQNWTFYYTSIGMINLSAISQIDVNWVGQVGAIANLQLWNFNTSSWNSIGSTIANTGVTIACGNNVYMTRSALNNITSYVSSSTIKARVYIPSAAQILTDAVEIIFHNNGSVMASLRGSSEVHVNNFFNGTLNITTNINQSQLDPLINYLITINGTAYQINYTTWQSWMMLQNLTLGNVSVSADVNWTEGYVETALLSFSDNIDGEAIELQTETLSCISNTTLQHSINGTKWINGVWYPFNETATELCQFGCANSMCSPSPLNGALYFFAFIAVILVAAGVIYTRKR